MPVERSQSGPSARMCGPAATMDSPLCVDWPGLGVHHRRLPAASRRELHPSTRMPQNGGGGAGPAASTFPSPDLTGYGQLLISTSVNTSVSPIPVLTMLVLRPSVQEG